MHLSSMSRISSLCADGNWTSLFRVKFCFLKGTPKSATAADEKVDLNSFGQVVIRLFQIPVPVFHIVPVWPGFPGNSRTAESLQMQHLPMP